MARLLRVSDFCRRFPQPEEELEDGHDDDDENDIGVGVGDDDTGNDNGNHDNGRYVDNLSAVPSWTWWTWMSKTSTDVKKNTTNGGRHEKDERKKKPQSCRRLSSGNTDGTPSSFSSSSSSSSCSTIYVPSSICAQISVQEGDLAWLSIPKMTTTRRTTVNRVPVRIVVLTTIEYNNKDDDDDGDDDQHYDTNDDLFHDYNNTTMVVVPPIILTNLGVQPRSFVDDQNNFFPMDGFRLDRMMTHSNKNNNINEDLTLLPAMKVILQPLGRGPPSWSDLILKSSTNGRNDSSSSDNQPDDTNKDDNENDHHTTNNDDEAAAWPLPSRNASELLQVTRLLSVTDRSNNQNETFYYQILSIDGESSRHVEEDDDYGCKNVEIHDTTVFRTSPQTVYEIDSSMIPRDASVRRLPPLCPPDIEIPPHPNCKTLAKLLIQSPARLPSSSLPYISNGDASSSCGGSIATRILHVVGTDIDNDLQRCIETASNMVGLQCFTVRGLAAFAFNQGHVVRTGSIADKLLGLESAFRYIRHRRMEPCVLHIQHLDSEFSSTDEQLRHDQEDRFWNKLVDELGQSVRSSSRSNPTTNTNSSLVEEYSYTPPIIVVCSTGKPLTPGPFLNSLVLPSIELSFPDDDYIYYLWSQEEVRNDSESSNNKRNLESKDLKLLRGRPVHEIIQLKRQINSKCSNNDDRTHQLKKLCQELDSKRRAKSSDVSHVSKVHWKDVGGLAHVRTEIMDAIEIPLKYPHLFPNKSGGRTGILLYGPPGTGKTLVAKAVATECGLPFLSVKGPELLGSYVGESEANIRNVFDSARRAASTNLPTAAAILFFDELDSLAPKRGEMNHGGGVMDRVVATLLAELDGSTTSGGAANDDDNSNGEKMGRVFVLGATNRPDLLDPSLIRPGRLDRLVYLGIPTDDEERAKVLASQLGKMKVEGDVMELALEVVSLLPPRLSGADISKLSSGAMVRAVQRLCNEAEQEFNRRHEGNSDNDTMGSQAMNKRTAIDKILESWGQAKCTPTITIEDLKQASLDVSPSITIEELARYESIRENLK